jgi:peroxiredoxin
MPAPDFALPDAADRMRRLSEFEGKPAALLFLCGCSRCYLMVGAVEEAEKQLRGERPRRLVVWTLARSEAGFWQKRTGFSALFLFEKNSQGPVIQKYAGHPCPRVYVLDRRHSIRYISPSPEGNAEPRQVVADLAAALREVSTPGPDRGSSPTRRG